MKTFKLSLGIKRTEYKDDSEKEQLFGNPGNRITDSNVLIAFPTTGLKFR